MDQEVIAAIAAGITAVAGAIAGGFTLMFKRMDKMLEEFKPNGGSSMKDQVNRMEKRIDALYKMMADRRK
jgi:hypothetical protein